MRILCVLPSLGPSGAGKQLEMLALGLHRQGQSVEVCHFGPSSPGHETGSRLMQAGVTVHSLGWKRAFDPVPLWRLHGIIRDSRPDVVHVWGRKALRAFALAGRKWLGRVVLSQPFAWEQRRPISALDRWLFGKVARIVVQGEAEAALGKSQGLLHDRLVVVPPGVMDSTGAIGAIAAAGPSPRMSGNKIVCIGPLAWHKGFRNAVWAFDFLRFLFTELQLVFVGTGPDEGGLRQMAHNTHRSDCTHFLPPQDAAGCLAEASACWVPSVRGGGTQAALEAMLAGRPVIATQVPSLHGLLVDGESGFYVPPDDKVNMARRTRQILIDPGLAQQLGKAARQRVLRHFSASAFVQNCQRVYQAAG